ncbi:MAG: hypothetical protein KDD68_20460, partial [Bdellovibrionales bacterium]|nr:hypothetical protein [Bdellovibrionales bacterium]
MKIFLLSHRWLRLSFFLLIITFLSSCEFSVSDRTDQTDSSSTDASSSDPSGNSGNPGSNNMDGGELPAAGSLAKWDDSCLDIHQFPLSPLASHIAYAGMYPAVRASKFSNFYPDWKETHDELKEWGNTIFIDYGFEEHFQSPRQQQDAFISKLRYAQRARKQVVLTMSAVFFGLDQNRLGERLVLRPDFQLRWGQFANLVLPYIGSIVAFRPTDEPYWRGRNQGLSNSQVKKALDTVARMVKRTFPTKPMFLIHNSVELDSQFLPLELYEWIGFNCYRSFESCGHAQINGLRSVPEWIRLLKSYMFSHQKI